MLRAGGEGVLGQHRGVTVREGQRSWLQGSLGIEVGHRHGKWRETDSGLECHARRGQGAVEGQDVA